MEEEIKRALAVLRKGGIILYPTDTIWGIGCDATNSDAVKRIYEIKKREESKAMIVLVDTAVRVARYVKDVEDYAWKLIEQTYEPLTIIYPNAINLADSIISEDKTIAIRVVKDEFCKNLIFQLNKPLVSTSANIAGQPHPRNFRDIEYEILTGVDYVVDWRQDETKLSNPSRIIKLLGNGNFETIR